jgi:CspA family cold shock protein
MQEAGRDMATGTVASFDHRKGFGYITPDDGGADIYVHVSAVERAGMPRLDVGDRVNFELQKDIARDRMIAVRLSFA